MGIRNSITVGDKYTRWTVIESRGKDNQRRNIWLCKCKCGNEKVLRDYTLTGGLSKSCGCLKLEILIERSTTHGKCGSSTYMSWKAMIDRCTRKSSNTWGSYGGRGIRVSDSWKSFENFLADMGEKPSVKHTLERIDNSKGYFKENCKWATRLEQARNTRSNILITHDGKTLCITEWAVALNLSRNTIRNRLNRGLSTKEVLKRTQ